MKTRLVTTGRHEAGRREAARQPTLPIRDPNISDSATMCGAAVSITSNTHFLPHLVPMSPGSWSFNLFSVFAPDGAAGDREAVSGYWVRIYVMVLKAEEGCSWTGQLLHLHAVAGIKWPHGLEMGPWMHDLISRRQRPTNTGHNVGASGGRQETKRKK